MPLRFGEAQSRSGWDLSVDSFSTMKDGAASLANGIGGIYVETLNDVSCVGHI